MNTDTGRLYNPEEYEALKRATGYAEGEIDVEFLPLVRTEGQEFAVAMEQGKIVEVSDEVADLIREGKASKERKAKRRAVAKARRKNRGR